MSHEIGSAGGGKGCNMGWLLQKDWSGFEVGDVSNISSLQLQNILKASPATYQAYMGHERV